MKILLSGSNGLVGSNLKEYLSQNNHAVVSLIRNKNQENSDSIYWDYENKIIDTEKLAGFDSVIHLAGENISSKRWSAKQKEKILNSRIKSTDFLIESLIKLENKPQSFLCASAIGFYGNRNDEILEEQSKKGSGFLSDVCETWEKSTIAAKQAGLRVVNLRFGVILSEKGGALKKMLLPFKLGLGGKVGTGKQYMSWITLDDTIRIIDFCLKNNSKNGPINVVAPNPITNYELTKLLGRYLKRPTFFPLPAFVAKLALGEMADELLLASTRVKPAVLLQNQFEFIHNTLDDFFHLT